MFLQRKALYNLIQINLIKLEGKEPPETKLEAWQMENYRSAPSETLFQDLEGLAIPLSSGDFEAHSKQFDTPEEMAAAFTEGRDPLEVDRAYLLIFELWRRYFPERQSLSVFCDELDHQILLYDLDQISSSTDLPDAVAYLLMILNDNVDEGVDPKTSFKLIQTYCANDLESFLYDYTLDQIEEGNAAYASELLEGFYPYLQETSWFDYLQSRTEILEDPEEGYEHLEAMINKQKAPFVELNLEILTFLASTGNHSLFSLVALKTIDFIENVDDFLDLLKASRAHYRYLELETPTQALEGLIEKQGEVLQSENLDELKFILAQKIHFAVE